MCKSLLFFPFGICFDPRAVDAFYLKSLHCVNKCYIELFSIYLIFCLDGKLFHTDLELYFINNYFLYLNETIISLPVNISSAHLL